MISNAAFVGLQMMGASNLKCLNPNAFTTYPGTACHGVAVGKHPTAQVAESFAQHFQSDPLPKVGPITDWRQPGSIIGRL
jgi:hypothetical protein